MGTNGSSYVHWIQQSSEGNSLQFGVYSF